MPKKGVKSLIYRGIFNTKPIQTIFILVAFKKKVDYVLQIINQLGVKKGAKPLILGSLIIFI